jgi:hypothetical protein
VLVGVSDVGGSFCWWFVLGRGLALLLDLDIKP